MRRVHHFLLPLLATSAFSISAFAAPVDLADDDTDSLDPKSKEQASLEAEAEAGNDDEAPGGAAADDNRAEGSDEETIPEDGQWLVGARFRLGITPKFLINWFGVEGGTTLITPGVGAEFGRSTKDFEILGAIGWQSYGMPQTAFRMPNDTEFDFFTSGLGLVTIEVDLAWKFHISKTIDVPIGAGLGLGVVTGKLTRTESYLDSSGALQPCAGAGMGPAGVLNGACETVGGQYGEEKAWPVYPIVDFRTGIRWQMHRHFIGRFDLGLGSTGFWLGLGADYGI